MREWLIREAKQGDEQELAEMMASLWPDGSVAEHLSEAETLIRTRKCGILPATFFIAEDTRLIGFIQVGLRSHADGCDPARPVGFIEGWFVDERFRNDGVGRELMHAGERWSKTLGCLEIASDALLENDVSHRAHSALGFDVVDRCVHYRKHLV